MKRIVFLIIASLLVLGLVLPGCDGNGEPVGDIVFEDGEINIGIPYQMNHMTGQFGMLGANIAKGAIDSAGGVLIDGQVHEFVLVPIETGEATVDPSGNAGKTALLDKIDDVHFLVGGFRSEAVYNYREVAVGPNGDGVIFITYGAASEYLQHSVAEDYTNYKYWFKGVPCNENFLAISAAKSIDAIGRIIRAEIGEASNYTLRAGVIHDNLVWCDDLLVVLEEELPKVNVNIATDPVAIDPLLTDPTLMAAALQPIKNVDPHFVISFFSADAGVVYAAVRKQQIPNAMAMGINVPAQFKAPWGALNNLAEPPHIAGDFFMDYIVEEAEVTPFTQPFLAAFMSYTGGEYPLYTAATYDGLHVLKAALEAEAWYDEDEGVGYANVDDIIAWIETNPQPGLLGTYAYYPQPGTTYQGKPALTSAQVTDLYPHIGTAGYPAYNVSDWVMPPHTTHDLAYGIDYHIIIGAQWQWDAGAGQWKKFAVWPMEMEGVDLKDQWGDWNFAYPGTKDIIIPSGVFKP